MKYFILICLFSFTLVSYISKKANEAGKADDGSSRKFAQFEKNFAETHLPYSVTVPSAMYNPFNTMGREAKNFIPEMKYSRFSRMTRSNGAYNARLLKTGKFSLLVYTLEESISDTLPPVSTTMASFDSTGKKIDSVTFACQCSPDRFKTGYIGIDRNIEIKEYKNIWLNEPKTFGYLGNEVIRKEVVNVYYYTLDDNGHFNLIKDAELDSSQKITY